MKKGAALPTAVALCTILLLVTTMMMVFLMSLLSNNKYSTLVEDQETMFIRFHNIFTKNPETNFNSLDETYYWKKYDGDDDQKALVARYKKSGEIKFYTICDFHDLDNIKTLAYQIDMIYAPFEDKVQYLGGFFPITGGAA